MYFAIEKAKFLAKNLFRVLVFPPKSDITQIAATLFKYFLMLFLLQ